MPRILFVSGFHPQTRARDLAHEFERYGQLVRCDVPAPRGYGSSARYAFVEFRETRDAEAAYHEMHGRDFEGSRLSVQWARNPPSAVWRLDRGTSQSSGDRERSPRGDDRRRDRGDRERERSPPRGGDRGRGDRDRERSPPRGNDRDRGRGDRDRERERERDGGDRRRSRSRSRSPRRSEKRRSRSHTPVDRKRTPSPAVEASDRARTPPREEPPSAMGTPPRD